MCYAEQRYIQLENCLNKKIPYCRNISKSNNKILETDAKLIPLTHIHGHYHSLSWLGRCFNK